MFIVPLLFIILVIWILAYLFKTPLSNTPADTAYSHTVVSSNRPLEILKERYAKGEISEEEYLRVKRNLE